MFILGWRQVSAGVILNTKKILVITDHMIIRNCSWTLIILLLINQVFNGETKQWDEVGPFGPYSFSDGGLFMAVPKHLFPNC